MCLHPLGDIKMDDGDSSASHDDVHAMDVNANEERVTSEDGGVEDAADTSLGPIDIGADGVAFAEQKKDFDFAVKETKICTFARGVSRTITTP